MNKGSEDNQPTRVKKGDAVVPPQSSPLDTSNWEDRPFYTSPAENNITGVKQPKSKNTRAVIYDAPAPEKKNMRITAKRERGLIMAPDDDTWVKRNRKRLAATDPEWLKAYEDNKMRDELFNNQKNAEPDVSSES